jgi:hypothetical protein
MVVFFSCSESEKLKSSEEKLVEASNTVIFSSVEQIGSHRFVSTFSRKEYHGEDVRSEHQEILQITWKDWDNFQSTRTVSDQVVSDVIISDFTTWIFLGEEWKKQPDGELYRTQLRMTWNQWDDVMRHFDEFVTWTPTSLEILDGRRTQKYVASFSRPTDTKTTFRPLSFQGKMWVDELTAVRVLGEIKGELGRAAYKKELRLQIQRSEIGGEFTITEPVPQK